MMNFFNVLNDMVEQTCDDEIRHKNGKIIQLRPEKKLSFPARDILKLDENEDTITLYCSFLGLYGVDSPLPGYFNEQCLREDAVGERFRSFLDILNHRNYLLYFWAWKAFCPDNQNQQGESAYFKIIEKMNCPEKSQGIGVCKQDIEKTIRFFAADTLFSIKECVVDWVDLHEVSTLGQGTIGENTLLGSRVLTTDTSMEIHLGPVASNKAIDLTPVSSRGKALHEALRHQCLPFIQCKLFLYIECSIATSKLEGHQAYLGVNTGLGQVKNASTVMYKLVTVAYM